MCGGVGHYDVYNTWGGEDSSMRTCESPKGETLSRADAPTIPGPGVSWIDLVYNWKYDSLFSLSRFYL